MIMRRISNIHNSRSVTCNRLMQILKKYTIYLLAMFLQIVSKLMKISIFHTNEMRFQISLSLNYHLSMCTYKICEIQQK